MKARAEILGHFGFFNGLPEHILSAIASCGVISNWSGSEYIAQEGQHAGAFYAIQSGIVTIEIHSPGQGRHILQTLHEGDVAGWSWLFAPHKWTFDIRAATSVQLIAFAGSQLLDVFAAHPDVGYIMVRRLAKVMALRLQAARLQLLDVYGNRSNSSFSERQHVGS
jgi:CRP/FNR family transcriptional regulator, cyclic AMP receptor protein